MSSDLIQLQRELDASIRMIEQFPGLGERQMPGLRGSDDKLANSEFENAFSLLDKCKAVCNESTLENRPLIRVMHHLACSGGSLIAKCIAAMPNVFLLSEVHPYTPKSGSRNYPRFAPTDISTLARYSEVPAFEELASRIFAHSVDEVWRHLRAYGGKLVLRDHSHSDFCLGNEPASEPGLRRVLQEDRDLISIVTMRNPIDCYLSLLNNQWMDFAPQSFDEYCRRVLAFMSAYPETEVFLYEDFVDDPHGEMEKMCAALQLDYSDAFEGIYDVFAVTGDSGRSGDEIESRARREISHEMHEAVQRSEHFKIICQSYDYGL